MTSLDASLTAETSKWAGVITAAITMSDVKVSLPGLTELTADRAGRDRLGGHRGARWARNNRTDGQEFAGTSAMNSAQTNYWYLGESKRGV